MMSFDVNSEQFRMISFPPIPNHGLAQIHLVNAQDELVMFATTGYSEMKIDMWILQERTWYRIHSFPLISLDLWCSITHYVTNGNKWFVMAKFQKIFEIDTSMMWFDHFIPLLSGRVLMVRCLRRPLFHLLSRICDVLIFRICNVLMFRICNVLIFRISNFFMFY
jgi:hypothetical protein